MRKKPERGLGAKKKLPISKECRKGGCFQLYKEDRKRAAAVPDQFLNLQFYPIDVSGKVRRSPKDGSNREYGLDGGEEPRGGTNSKAKDVHR